MMLIVGLGYVIGAHLILSQRREDRAALQAIYERRGVSYGEHDVTVRRLVDHGLVRKETAGGITILHLTLDGARVRAGLPTDARMRPKKPRSNRMNDQTKFTPLQSLKAWIHARDLPHYVEVVVQSADGEVVVRDEWRMGEEELDENLQELIAEVMVWSEKHLDRPQRFEVVLKGFVQGQLASVHSFPNWSLK